MAIDPTVSWNRRFRRHMLGWYEQARRQLPWRDTDDPWAIWVSEVMLQQTQVKTARPYYLRFLSRFPNAASLSRADPQQVLKLWEGLGYYSRARNLQAAARIVAVKHQGRVPQDPETFRALPGVGPYICAAVMSIAFGRPLAVVDGNVKRVLARLLMLDEPVNRPAGHGVFQKTADLLLYRRDPGCYNQAVMELGALVCRPNRPECPACPVQALCGARAKGRETDFPVREQRPRPPLKHLVAGVVWRGDRVLIAQRPAGGLLGGLWEFPGGPVNASEPAEEACRRCVRETTGVAATIGPHLGKVNHAYTHFRIAVTVFHCRYRNGRLRPGGPADVRWVSWPALADLPFHKAHHKIMARVDASASIDGRNPWLKKADP